MAEEVKASPSPRKPRGLVGIAILLIIVVSVIGYFVYQTISPGKAALMIESIPNAIVFINGEQKGKTPFEVEMSVEEITIKLVPESFTVPLSPYETKVRLAEGVKTIVRRNFGESAVEESGQIISFEKKSANETSIAVISNPDGVEVSIDGENKGVTPLKIDTASGDHTLTLSASSYEENTFSVRAVNGYTLTAIIDMAKLPPQNEVQGVETSVEENIKDEPEVQKIKVDDTTVGYLRVRDEASANSEELGRVNPGDEFEVLEHNSELDWYKIEFDEDGNEGWISGEFVTQIEEE